MALVLIAAADSADGGSPRPPPAPFVSSINDPLLAPAVRAAREVKTWDEARALVRENSTDERSAAAAVERAQGRWRQALSALLPNARAAASAQIDVLNPSVAPLVGVSQSLIGTNPPTVPLGTTSVFLSQALVDLGAWKGLGAARAARTSAEASLADVRRRVIQGLARSLVAVVAAETVAELNRVGLRQALERAALIERTAQLGAATQVDVVRTRQDVDVARGTLIAGDEQLRRTREALGLALGLGEEVGVPAGFALSGLTEEAQRVCKPIDWENRSDLEAARASVESAKETRRQAVVGYLPTLGLTSNLFGYTTSPGPGRFATWNVAAVLTVPIWEGGAREGLVVERQGLETQAVQALEASRRQVRLEVTQAQRAVGVAQALASSASDARASAAQLDALTRRSFEVGRGSSLELVQSAAALRQADVGLATREYELVQARLDVLLTEALCDW
jgi:outer membrane protein TolC